MPKLKCCPAYLKFYLIEHGREVIQHCVVTNWNEKTIQCGYAIYLAKTYLEMNHVDKMNRDQSYFLQLGENVKRQRMDESDQIQQKGAEIANNIHYNLIRP